MCAFSGLARWLMSVGENMAQNLPKVGVNRQFQAETPKYKNHNISEGVNPIKRKCEDKADYTSFTVPGWSTIRPTQDQIQHGRRPPS